MYTASQFSGEDAVKLTSLGSWETEKTKDPNIQTNHLSGKVNQTSNKNFKKYIENVRTATKTLKILESCF